MLSQQLKSFLPVIGLALSFPVLSQSAPLTCDGTAYLVSAANARTSSTIALANGDTGALTGTTITPSIRNVYNAVGYNNNDNLLYATINFSIGAGSAGDIVTIDANGVVTNLGKPTPNGSTNLASWNDYLVSVPTTSTVPSVSLYTGVIQGNTYYFFGRDSDDNKAYLISVDLISFTYTDIEVSLGLETTDMAFSKQTGLVYGLYQNQVISTNPATGQQTILTSLPSPPVVTAGGAWSDSNGDIFFYANSTSRLYKYDVNAKTLALISTVSGYSYFDATACYPPTAEKSLVNSSSPQASPFDPATENAEIGETLTYNISISNPDSVDKLNVPIKDSLLMNLPTGAILSAGPTASSGNLSGSNGDYILDNIAAGTTTIIEYEITLPTDFSQFDVLPNPLINNVTIDGQDPTLIVGCPSYSDLCTSTPLDKSGTIPPANPPVVKKIPSQSLWSVLLLVLTTCSLATYLVCRKNK